MFSHDLFQALCQNPNPPAQPAVAPAAEREMVDAIQRALDTYQRLHSDQPRDSR